MFTWPNFFPNIQLLPDLIEFVQVHSSDAQLIKVCVSNVGDYYCGRPADIDQEPDEEWVKGCQNDGRAYQEWDEDADVDESGEVLF